MKREIKFRAWNEGKMVDLLAITPLALDANMNTQLALKGMSGLFLPFGGGIEIMQYTGLHDKNGREIYEGDILDFDEREWGGRFKPEVIWMENIIGDWNYCGSLGDVTEWRKVIGNIYENPELLKA